jgi:hypothetical protein
MSNWAVVMVVWSDLEPDDNHLARLERVSRRWAELELSTRTAEWIVVPPCGHEYAPGSACEFVAATHWNHFAPDDLLAALREESWEWPSDVGVLWKGEQMCHYQAVYLEEEEDIIVDR